MRIDLPCKIKITQIGPNRFSWGDKLIEKDGRLYIQRTTDFRTHPKFAKRIYFAFRPFWWLLHIYDSLFAERFAPQLAFGFSTLTTYPQAGSGGSNVTCDGNVYRYNVDETFTAINTGSGHNADNTGTELWAHLASSGTTNQFTSNYKAIATFDTSSIGANSTLQSATMSLYGSLKNASLGPPDLHIAGATPASNNALVAADYGQVQTTSFGSITYANFSTSGYNDIALNSSGLSNINKTGISKFSFQLNWQINNSFTGTWDSWALSYMHSYSADQTGTTQDPKLVVTYLVVYDETNRADTLLLSGTQADLQNYREARTTSYIIADTKADLQNYREARTTSYNLTEAKWDFKAYFESLIDSLILSESKSDLQTYADVLNILLALTETKSDLQAYIENPATLHVIADTKTDLQNYLEFLQILQALSETEFDFIPYIESLTDTFLLSESRTELQNYIDALSTIYSLTQTEVDTKLFFEILNFFFNLAETETDSKFKDERFRADTFQLSYTSKDLQFYLERLIELLQHAHAKNELQDYLELLQESMNHSTDTQDIKESFEQLADLLTQIQAVQGDIYGDYIYNELNRPDTFQSTDSVNDELLKTIAKLRYLLVVKN